MANRMQDKIVIVTGAAGGIGTEISRHMAREGATVLAADINIEGAEIVAGGLGNKASAVYYDAYDEASVKAMVQTAIDRYGRLDVLVNNAADTSLTPLDTTVLDTEVETFDKSYNANLRSVFIATKATLPHLLATRGSIVNIASGSALFGDIWLVAYSSMKAGVIQLTRNTAVQYGPLGVRCNSICPGFIAHGKAREWMPDTVKAAFQAGFVDRNGEPQDIAALAVFLASDDAGFINGQNITSDGGHTAGAIPYRPETVNLLVTPR